MIAQEEYLTCAELYEGVLRHPDYRIVKALPGNKDACTPLRFVPGGEELCFAVDLASTAMHRHGWCSELLDLLGEELPEELADKPVVFLDIGVVDPRLGERAVKLSADADAKWLKIHV